MFNCNKCKKAIGPGVRENKVVVETRAKTYPERYAKTGTDGERGERGFHTKAKVIDKGGSGFETVREVALCPDCAVKSEG